MKVFTQHEINHTIGLSIFCYFSRFWLRCIVNYNALLFVAVVLGPLQYYICFLSSFMLDHERKKLPCALLIYFIFGNSNSERSVTTPRLKNTL